ncbi:hypothetical protein LINPERHAP2_LOCUS18456, partial [Linum perenne]
EWRPYFRPEESFLSTLRVWVRLPGIPFEYFDGAILKLIGDRIDKEGDEDEAQIPPPSKSRPLGFDVNEPLIEDMQEGDKENADPLGGVSSNSQSSAEPPSLGQTAGSGNSVPGGLGLFISVQAGPKHSNDLPVGPHSSRSSPASQGPLNIPVASNAPIPMTVGPSAATQVVTQKKGGVASKSVRNPKSKSRVAISTEGVKLKDSQPSGEARDVAIIVEPKISKLKASKVIEKMGFAAAFRVDAVGFKGGVWLVWDPNSVKLNVVEYGSQFIHVEGKLEDGSSYFCTAVYASPVPTERVLLWDALKRISSSMVHPWITLGDFNSILSADDKSGGAPFNRARNKSFIDMFDICGFSDLRVQGPRFTWARNGILVRLDRALVNYRWLDLFPDSSTLHLHKLKSDHRPILVRPQAQVFQSNDKPFRFISAWFTHASFNYFLSKKWLKGHELPDALCSLSNDLCHWNKHVFGNIFRRKKEAYEPADAR